MIVTTEYAEMPGSPMRTFVASPKAEGRYPGIWCFSDLFQLAPPMLRTCVRLTGYGFVAAAPEIYRRIEPPGTVIPFDDAGRTRGQQDAAKTPVATLDTNCLRRLAYRYELRPFGLNVARNRSQSCPGPDGRLMPSRLHHDPRYAAFLKKLRLPT